MVANKPTNGEELSGIADQLRELILSANDAVHECLAGEEPGEFSTRDEIRHLVTLLAGWDPGTVDRLTYSLHDNGIDPAAVWRLSGAVETLQNSAWFAGFNQGDDWVPDASTVETVVQHAGPVYDAAREAGMTLVLAERTVEAKTGEPVPQGDDDRAARRVDVGKPPVGRPTGPTKQIRDVYVAGVVECRKAMGQKRGWASVAKQANDRFKFKPDSVDYLKENGARMAYGAALEWLPKEEISEE